MMRLRFLLVVFDNMVSVQGNPDMHAVEQLLKIMEDLRNPQSGCPWDIKQNYKTVLPYTLEEAYEVADAIETGNMQELKTELGDLLFQIVFYAQMAKEDGLFEFTDVVEGLNQKLLRRHPHVFGNVKCRDEKMLNEAWEKSKADERSENSEQGLSALAGVAVALPALKRSQKLQKRAASKGFDWPEVTLVFHKIAEEINELQEAVAEKNSSHIEEEMGDLLFACVNLSRHLNVDAEEALRKSNQKFIHRFEQMEKELRRDNKSMEDCELEYLEALWHKAKQEMQKKTE